MKEKRDYESNFQTGSEKESATFSNTSNILPV